ncbi:nitric oxide reductase NorE protein [Marinobacter sp. es.048]|uniref:cytochrome c oxidase subunit 3 n=1 Tax=Marinobacter sp. es.048 TaxID=1761795 RepID=UPI000B58EC2B|nr:cytochrome c oxidase subunit 3 [Marinobacter sp. es.048]SNC62672.1 nitric oxide reductase NorE protein [Marinobacter sp. es.048]
MEAALRKKQGLSGTVYKRKRLPAEEGLWVFVLGDTTIFGLFFVVFAYYFSLQPDMYRASQAYLNVNFGVLNTLLLLTSSWFVVIALNAVRSNLREIAGRFTLAAIACGAGFGVVKILEYREKIHADITPMTNDFFMFYFIFTGIHFVHLLVGMGLLIYFWRKTRAEKIESSELPKFESVAVYWHMVDFLWIVLFPLLYLIR